MSARIAGQPSSGPGPEGTFLVSGADLYRLSCESCHKADGGGAPPGINSLIGPVQATSPAMIRQQMKQRGVEVESKMVAELALQAETALRKRLQNGGEKMPPFRDLNGKEVEALIGYLRDLAGVPGADRGQTLLNEPALRVGELLVKGTCHICHDATGRGLRRNIEAAPGEIPSLASLPEARTQLEMIRKVREGFALPDAMVISGRGEMPLFVYITPEEVAAAYMYLLSYPPRSGERRDTTSGGRAP